MKNFTLFLVLLFFSRILYSQCEGQPQAPEFYFFAKDYIGTNYRIYAEKYGTSLIYNKDYQSTDVWNNQWERTDGYGNPTSFYAAPNTYIQTNRGFDWDTHLNSGTGAGCRGVLGYGLYRVDIQRQDETSQYITVFSFYFDTRQDSWTGSPDLEFHFDYLSGSSSLTVNKLGSPPHSVLQNDTIKLCVELGFQQDWSSFILNSSLKNDFNGSLNSNIPMILEEPENGFPLEQYNPGHSFTAGSTANFWKESFNEFSVTSGVVNFSGSNFKVRHWNIFEVDYGNVGRVQINTNTQTAFFKNVSTLTVNSNLEGGIGGTYQIT